MDKSIKLVLFAVMLGAGLGSCDLLDVDAQHDLSVTIFEDVSSMDTRNYETMTISVPGSEDQTITIHYNPNVSIVGNPPYGGVDDYDVIDISWYGKKEVAITVAVGSARADVTVSNDKQWFLYQYPNTISQ